MILNILFLILLVSGIALFTNNVRKVIRNIKLGKDLDRNDKPSERFSTMLKVALGQSKMVVRPVAGVLHIIVYAGFIIINIEVIEILIDGVFGTHRALFGFLDFLDLTVLYNFLIGSFEFLGFGVAAACAIFLVRRNVLKLKRFWSPELTAWPRSDANIILFGEISLMTAFLTMNAADYLLQQYGVEHYIKAGAFPVSANLIAPLLSGLSITSLMVIERFCWWFHIIGILAFINYLPYSKHFHIILAFPNVYFSNLNNKGKFTNMEAVTKEVKLMLDPNANPYAAVDPNAQPVHNKFGAKDVTDLSWKQLMDAYSCTECGRCTSNCPANITGKLLSPRKIMMDTRDRLEEIGKGIDKNGKDFKDEKSLLGDYIKPEELWACTSCNACVESCPVNIDPLSIIVDMRRFLVMEQSAAPNELNLTFNNIENNGAPWQFPQANRLKWAEEN